MKTISKNHAARICAAIALFAVCNGRIAAQDFLYEIGGGFGAAQYFGDANRGLFGSSGVGLELVGRYNYNFRWAFSTMLDWRTLRGDTDKSGNVFPDFAQADFKVGLTQLHVRSEFNFLPYSDGYKYLGTARLSPYVAAGLSLGFASGAKGSAFAPGITAGMGVKYKLKPRINVGIEYSFTGLLTDALDALTDKSVWLDDPYKINDSWVKNKDATGALVLRITYDFGLRKTFCNKQ